VPSVGVVLASAPLETGFALIATFCYPSKPPMVIIVPIQSSEKINFVPIALVRIVGLSESRIFTLLVK